MEVVDMDLEDRLWIKYRTIYSFGTERITRKTLIEALEAPYTDEDEFRHVFVLLMLNVLCSTTCHRLKKKYLHAAAVVKHAKYNWCSLILDELLHAMGSFGKRFYKNGFAGGSGGCTLFLLLFNLDRLNRKPLEWNKFLRLKVWTTKEMSKAYKEDQFGTGGFKKKGCLDVPYGGDVGHPLKAKDYSPANRKREEDDEVIADTDDEDLEWLTTDVKERRTLVKEEYAYQKKKKKSREVLNEPLLEEEAKKKRKYNKKAEVCSEENEVSKKKKKKDSNNKKSEEENEVSKKKKEKDNKNKKSEEKEEPEAVQEPNAPVSHGPELVSHEAVSHEPEAVPDPEAVLVSHEHKVVLDPKAVPNSVSHEPKDHVSLKNEHEPKDHVS